MSSSSMEQGEAKTPNKGKRKIPIEPITNKTRKQVTFSKRRGGLFKKGSELCSLCGAEVAIITFSGAGKFFGFGHPSDEAVIQRYINSFNNNVDNKVIKCNEHLFDNNINNNNNNNMDFGKYSQQYKDVIGQIEVEKRASTSAPSSNFNYSGVDIKNININTNNYGNSGGFWWDEMNINELGLVELEQFKVALEGLRNEVAIKVDEMNRESMSIVPQNFDFGAQDGNTVAHYCQGYDGSSSNTCWIDHGMAVPVDSYVDLLTKRQA